VQNSPSQFPQTPNQIPQSPLVSAQIQAGLREQQVKQIYDAAGSNFYSIATFSLINSVIGYFKIRIYFPIGLGVTQIIDSFSRIFQQEAPKASVFFFAFGVVLNLLIFAVVAIFGFAIKKRTTWLILVGGIFYLLDGLLLLFFQDWIGAAFHAYFLFRIWTSWQAIQKLSKPTNL
jgi:hypothetical protein